MSQGIHQIVSGMVDEWKQLRTELQDVEQSEHPDIVDCLGRLWTWVDKDLYRHDNMATTRNIIESTGLRFPQPKILDNPNYTWCNHCLAGIKNIRGVDHV
jgi:hypothetical protein